eukprot:3571353-Rhodomonas_salina.6
MSGTNAVYGATRYAVHRSLPNNATHRAVRCYAICLRTHYAMSGTDVQRVLLPGQFTRGRFVSAYAAMMQFPGRMVPASDRKIPDETKLGHSSQVEARAGTVGHIARNVRLSLLVIDVAEPYVVVITPAFIILFFFAMRCLAHIAFATSDAVPVLAVLLSLSFYGTCGADMGHAATRLRVYFLSSPLRLSEVWYQPTRLLRDVRYWHSICSPRHCVCCSTCLSAIAATEVPCAATSLRTCYVMSSTDIVYALTQTPDPRL